MNTDVYPPFNFSLGRPLKYLPEELIAKFQDYIQWAKENPIEVGRSEAGVDSGGRGYGKDVIEKKPRLVSIGGFLVYLGATDDWWQSLDRSKKRGADFSRVKAFVRAYCENYQKEMASMEIFNANIISRLLGLSDKVEHTGEEFTIVVKNKGEAKKIEKIADLGI